MTRLRPARPADARAVWEWLQDPEVRAAAFSSAPIPWDTHQPWFERRLAPGGEPYLIAEDERGERVGQVRFERREGILEVSIVVAPGARGRGLGRALLREACAGMPRPVQALVRADNPASLKAFEAAGFVRIGTLTVAGVAGLRLLLR